MKQIISIGLILVLSLQCFYKLGIITYFQINRQYIAEVLCINKKDGIPTCNGQCFLKKKLDIAESPITEEQNLPEQKSLDLPVFVISDIEYIFGCPTREQDTTSSYSDSMSSGFRSIIFHPPLAA